jgi:cytochrome c6
MGEHWRILVTRSVRLQTGLAAVLVASASLGFSEAPGQALYTTKCQMCHGATGQAETAMGKATKTRPLNDPEVAKLSEAEMITVTRSGKGKMQPFKGELSEEQIKDAVAYFRSLK